MLKKLLFLMTVSALAAGPAFAQSQAINGTIEGTVSDPSGGVLPGTTVTVVNIDTGTERIVVANEHGLYRAPLLPLGTYRLTAELQGFKKFEQSGITLSAGQTAVVNVVLGVGQVSETVLVQADSPVVDLAKVDQGRTLNEREIRTLPLTSRNPYNFALLQPGVVGFETQEFGVPRITANGALLRVNYQIDGNDNTEKDRAGLRQMPMSEVMLREVKVVTTGYAPEFGQTMGLVYNAITPSGANRFKGDASYRMQRKSFAALPFFVTTTQKPPTEVNIFTVANGGPIVRDKTFYFAGFENTRRDLSGGRVITIAPATVTRLGLNEPQYMPALENTKFVIGKIDHEFSTSERLSVRSIAFDNFITNNIGGGITSVQRATDFTDRQYSTAGQLVSTLANNVLNEARVQYASRRQGRVPGAQAGAGPAVNIPSAANFGGPVGASADAGFGFTEGIFSVNDNLTVLRGNHSYKVGVHLQSVRDTRTQTLIQVYTFPSVDAYLAAKSGAAPFGYTSFAQFLGQPSYDYTTQMYAGFAQDDWRITPNLKVLYGLRYDAYTPPDGVANAPVTASQKFPIDKSNFQPRGGFVYTMGANGRTVIRGNTGLMYDQPINAMFEQAIVNDGTSLRASISLQPNQAGAPAFPTVIPSGVGSPSNTAWTVDPAFEIARMWQNNIQFERGFRDTYSASLGFSYTRGRNLPVVSNINLINSLSALSDGRPVFNTAINSTTRVDPRYNAIFATQALGDSTYRAMTVQLTRRFNKGLQFDLAYSLAKSEDTAPITSTLSVQGDAGRVDPSSLERDRGPNILDQRHTFVGSLVAQPDVKLKNNVANVILNHNQIGLSLQFASGIPVNVRSNRELNNDSVTSDRPVGVPRNSLRLPARYNVDLRYSRVIPIGWNGANAEVIAELKNVFNTEQWAGVTSTITTDLNGNPAAPIPVSADQFASSGGYEQRQFQLGFKVRFSGRKGRKGGKGEVAPSCLPSSPSCPSRPSCQYHSPMKRPLLVCLAVMAALATIPRAQMRVIPIDEEQGHVALGLALRHLGNVGIFMHTTAHPDDENNGLLVMMNRGMGYRTALATATRGNGGQNEIGPEIFEALGLLRTGELAALHRFDGAEQYFTRAVDFGYSFSIEETFQKWGRDEITADYVRLIRMIRPDVIITLPPTGNAGGQHHMASAVITRDAYTIAGDPTKYPEQIKDGLRAWQPRKLYETAFMGFPGEPQPTGRVVRITSAVYDPLLGKTYAEIGAEARSMHKCQGMGQLLALPLAPMSTIGYQLVETTLPAQMQRDETLLFDGIDTTMMSLARYAGPRPPKDLTEGLTAISNAVQTAQKIFDTAADEGTVKPLLDGLYATRVLRSGLRGMAIDEAAKYEIDFRLRQKEGEFQQAAMVAKGIKIEALADDGVVVPGQTVKVDVIVANRGAGDVAIKQVTFDGFQGQPSCTMTAFTGSGFPFPVARARGNVAAPPAPPMSSVRRDQVAHCEPTLTIPSNARVTEPYWHRKGEEGRYTFDADAPFGLPTRSTPFYVQVTLGMPGGGEVIDGLSVQYRYEGDIFSGEKRSDLLVVPALSVRVSPGIAMIPAASIRSVPKVAPPPPTDTRAGRGPGAAAGRASTPPARGRASDRPAPTPPPPSAPSPDREIRVTVTNDTNGAAQAKVRLNVPVGWSATPPEQAASFERQDETRTVRFQVKPALGAAPGEFHVGAIAVVNGREFGRGFQVVEYPHIRRYHIYDNADATLKVTDVRLPENLKVGYVMGVGDQVPSAIEQLGASVEMISADDLAWGDLSRFDVIVTGVRAYERRADLRANNARLLDYVFNGGTAIVQYNKFEFNEAQYGPYPALVSSNRVTDEFSPVQVLDTHNPIFTTPNEIGEGAWKNWVQERGLYFLGEKDPRYRDLIQLDEHFTYNKGAKTGALVEANYGKGRWVYVGLGLWRQLPAGTEGAYQLLANLIALGKYQALPKR